MHPGGSGEIIEEPVAPLHSQSPHEQVAAGKNGQSKEAEAIPGGERFPPVPEVLPAPAPRSRAPPSRSPSPGVELQ